MQPAACAAQVPVARDGVRYGWRAHCACALVLARPARAPELSIGSSTFHVERRLPSLRTLKPACAWCVDCSWTGGEAHLKRRGSVRPAGAAHRGLRGPPSPIRNSRPEIGDRHRKSRRYLYQLSRCERPAKPQGAWRRARRSRVRGAAAALEGQALYQAVHEASSERKDPIRPFIALTVAYSAQFVTNSLLEASSYRPAGGNPGQYRAPDAECSAGD